MRTSGSSSFFFSFSVTRACRNKNAKQPMKISVQLHMKPHMSMCQRINVPQNMYRSVNHRMDMEAKTANPFQNKNVTRFAQSGTIDQNFKWISLDILPSFWIKRSLSGSKFYNGSFHHEFD